jgi:hypothetical protein
MEKFEKGGVIYYPLHIACPVCREKGISMPIEYWHHAGCDGLVFVGDDAYFICDKCGFKEFALHLKFQCPSCSESDDYYIQQGTGNLPEIIACTGCMLNEAGQQWLLKFFSNLGEF